MSTKNLAARLARRLEFSEPHDVRQSTAADEHVVTGRLLTAEEVAELTGMTKEWVWAQARADRIPHVRLGRYCRFREEAIDAWLEAIERGRGQVSITRR
jgi:excisionase family DNA binding protein